ncbi:ComEA family DNA-binding protein [Saccharicrinis sp. 156]|uniref:ComEA family DNA-binding protein n=1 Tax=Saccharicrinis sp. 156 TaxID=3417574 RepID=UPI003D3468CC
MPYWAWYFVSKEFDKDFVEQVKALNNELVAGKYAEKSDSLFLFNPNLVSTEELLALGLSSYQSKSLIGFRNKVGNFTSKNDLLKVYGMDSSTYFKLWEFILLPDEVEIVRNDAVEKERVDASEKMAWINFNNQDEIFWERMIDSDIIRKEILDHLQNNRITKSLPLDKVEKYPEEYLLRWLKKNSEPTPVTTLESEEHVKLYIELNSADTTRLKLMRGIGSKLSARIVNFRNSLGGFYQKSQLNDVYGISDELYCSLKENVSVDTGLIKKINPHGLKVEEISKHGYFSYQQAKDLKNLYRKKKLPNEEDILKLKSINQKDWERIKHYLVWKK